MGVVLSSIAAENNPVGTAPRSCHRSRLNIQGRAARVINIPTSASYSIDAQGTRLQCSLLPYCIPVQFTSSLTLCKPRVAIRRDAVHLFTFCVVKRLVCAYPDSLSKDKGRDVRVAASLSRSWLATLSSIIQVAFELDPKLPELWGSLCGRGSRKPKRGAGDVRSTCSCRNHKNGLYCFPN